MQKSQKRKMLSKVVTVVEDPDNPGELLLDLGDELCEQMGWSEGDTLEWQQLEDGKWSLKKISSQ